MLCEQIKREKDVRKEKGYSRKRYKHRSSLGTTRPVSKKLDVYWPLFFKLVESWNQRKPGLNPKHTHSSPSYSPSPDVAHAAWIYQALCLKE